MSTRGLVDAHYTPSWLARQAVQRVTLSKPRIIADVAAGEGSLLIAAEQRWSHARIIATDIDPATVGRLRRRHPKWHVGRCDFLNERSRVNCRALSDPQLFSLLLLNPPFSCRGGTAFLHTTENDRVLRVSAAMAFLLEGLKYLASDGQALAILPAGSLHSAKDKAAWAYLELKHQLDVVGTWGKTAFPGCSATSALVHVQPLATRRRRRTPPQAPIEGLMSATVVRGTCPIHAAPAAAAGPTLVHTTDLQQSRVILNGHRGFGSHRCVRGPVVIMPRVGQFTAQKIALLEAEDELMLSDCVIALKAASKAETKRLHRLLLSHANHLKTSYVGTGAPFITLERLQLALKAIGVAAQ